MIRDNKKQVEVVVALRGLAALAVAVLHIVNAPVGFMTNEVIRSITFRGASGVQLFFIISGFVIPLSLIRGSYHFSRLGKFMLKRTIRIEPTYLVVIALSFAFVAFREALLSKGEIDYPSAVQVLQNVTYLVPFVDGEWINPVFWTLGVELQYYLLIACVWTLAKRIPPNLGLGLLVLSAWLGCEYTRHDFITYWLAYFNLGILLALHFESKIKTQQLIFFGVTNLVIIWLFNGVYFTALGTLGCSSIYFFPHLKGGRLLSFLGRQSYSLYLIHVMVGCSTVNVAMRFLDHSNPLIQLVIVLTALLVSVISAEILYRMVERPTMHKSKSITFH